MRKLQVAVPERESSVLGSTGPEVSCELCDGRGWVLEKDSGAGSALPCECRLQALGPRLLAASGILERYETCTLDGFKTSAEDDTDVRVQLGKALAASKRYVDEFLRLDGSYCDHGLIFIGPTGTGKTHLAVAILRELIQRYRVRGRFVEFTALIKQLQATFGRDSEVSIQTILDPILRADVLVIDELGAQKPSAWVQDILYLIVNGRYSARLPTLFTTNYLLDEPERPEPPLQSLDRGPGPEEKPVTSAGPEPLAYRLPATLVSRLCEMAKPVELVSAADYRRVVLMQRRRM